MTGACSFSSFNEPQSTTARPNSPLQRLALLRTSQVNKERRCQPPKPNRVSRGPPLFFPPLLRARACVRDAARDKKSSPGLVLTYPSISPSAVDLASLTAPQLSQVKKQLDDELEHLTSSFSQLRAAQAKFKECLRCIAAGVTDKIDGTASLRPPLLRFPWEIGSGRRGTSLRL